MILFFSLIISICYALEGYQVASSLVTQPSIADCLMNAADFLWLPVFNCATSSLSNNAMLAFQLLQSSNVATKKSIAVVIRPCVGLATCASFQAQVAMLKSNLTATKVAMPSAIFLNVQQLCMMTFEWFMLISTMRRISTIISTVDSTLAVSDNRTANFTIRA